MKKSTKDILIPVFVIAVAASILSACDRSETETEGGAAPAQAEGNGVEAYPLTTCVVSGEELGSMGEPVVIEHAGTTVKFCCKSCLPEFNADPEAYLSKLR